MQNFKKAIFFITTFLTGFSVFAQNYEVDYYEESGRKVDKTSADFFEVTESGGDGSTAIGHVTRYTMDSVRIGVQRFYDLGNRRIKHGDFMNWYPNGQRASQGHYQDGKLHGNYNSWYKNGQLKYTKEYMNGELQDTLKGYYEDGALRRLEVYKNAKMREGHVYAKDGAELPYLPARQAPQFPHGEKAMLRYLVKNIKYPKSLIGSNILGTVKVSFVVKEDGSLSDIRIIENVHFDMDSEVIRVIASMPKWEPGKQEGKPVEVRYTLPVRFSANTDTDAASHRK